MSGMADAANKRTGELRALMDKALPAAERAVAARDHGVKITRLQKQIAQFEQVTGVVKSIEKDSTQLREALLGEQARIIVTTLQKFPALTFPSGRPLTLSRLTGHVPRRIGEV